MPTPIATFLLESGMATTLAGATFAARLITGFAISCAGAAAFSTPGSKP